MCRGHLKTSRTEVHFHVLIHYYRDCTPYHRDNYALAFKPLVALVVGVDAYGGIAEDGLGACCCHYYIAVLALHIIT